MLGQAEDAGAVGLRVAADAFEDGGAVVDDVDMTWMLALSQGMSLPLCQMFWVVAWMGIVCSPFRDVKLAHYNEGRGDCVGRGVGRVRSMR